MVVALYLAIQFVPAHVDEATDPVDNLGGILSVLLVAAVVLAINFPPVPNEGALALGLAAIAVAAGLAFVIRQRRATSPLYDLDVAGRRIFWVAACAGIIVFGTLMGAMFVGKQFLVNVPGYFHGGVVFTLIASLGMSFKLRQADEEGVSPMPLGVTAVSRLRRSWVTPVAVTCTKLLTARSS